MNRRKLLSILAGLPLVGGWAAKAQGLRIKPLKTEEPIGDGVALNSMSHPYAVVGETVTCENGHPVCDFIETVQYGQIQDLPRQLGNWRQNAPTVGDFPIPGCAICGAPFANGSHFHIGESWRLQGREHPMFKEDSNG